MAANCIIFIKLLLTCFNGFLSVVSIIIDSIIVIVISIAILIIILFQDIVPILSYFSQCAATWCG